MRNKRLLWIVTVILPGLALSALGLALVVSSVGAQGKGGGDHKPDRTEEHLSFQYEVRGDFFRGLLAGDAKAWERAAETIAKALEDKPEHAEAMTWQGSMILVEAGNAYQNGEFDEGMRLWKKGLARMDEGVGLSPIDPNTRIPRGVTLVKIWGYETDAKASRQMLAKGVADLELAQTLLAPFWDEQSVHARGEILVLLAQGNKDLGFDWRAKHYVERVLKELPDTKYPAKVGSLLEDMGDKKESAANKGSGGYDVASNSALAPILEALPDDGIAQRIGADFVAAIDGDDEALTRAKVAVEAALAEKETAARVAWHGAVLVQVSGRMFMNGEWQDGISVWEDGCARLDEGVALDPNDLSARIARGWTFLNVAQHERDPDKARDMREKAAADYQALMAGVPSKARAARETLTAGLARVQQED